MISAFPNMKPQRSSGHNARTNVSDVVIRDFSGALKVTDNDSALRSRYATVLSNMNVQEDRSLRVRHGTKVFADLGQDIVNMEYFNERIVVVLASGVIVSITNEGFSEVIWSAAIAVQQPGAPAGWSDNLTEVDFEAFKTELIVTNGVDKPVVISQNFGVSYLQDLLTGANVNVPISKYVATNNQFVVMAAVNETAEIYISSRNTSGTWPGDPEPNDAVTFDLSAYVGRNSRRIRGLKSFRSYIVVFFETTMVILQLGNYNEAGVHTPQIVDDFTRSGVLNNNCILTTDKDLLFFNQHGIFSAVRNILGSSIESKGLNENLGKEFFRVIGDLSSETKGTFIVDDNSDSTMYFFINTITGSQVYSLQYNEDLTVKRWGEVTGLDFEGATVSALKRIFFFRGSRIFQFGNNVFDDEAYYGDEISPSNEFGTAIPFDYESPWLDAQQRMKVKRLINVILETKGSTAFKFQVFVDNIYKDVDGNYDPAVELDLQSGDDIGYGFGGVSSGYGGGRPTDTERMYRLPAKFKKIKFRISGSTNDPFVLQAMGLIFATGSYMR